MAVGVVLVGCPQTPKTVSFQPGQGPAVVLSIPHTPEQAQEPDERPTRVQPPVGPAPAWDDAAPVETCTPQSEGGLLEEALEARGLTRSSFGFDETDYSSSAYYTAGDLDDPFLMGWFRATHNSPETAPCFARDRAAGLDALVEGHHPVAAAVRHAAALAHRWKKGEPLDSRGHTNLRKALTAVCAAGGYEYDPGKLDLPLDLQTALTPVFQAIAHGVEEHRLMVQTQTIMSAQAWLEGGNIGMAVFGQYTKLKDPAAVAYLNGKYTRPALNLAAARIAFAIESVDWAHFRGLKGVSLDLDTPLGKVRIRDAGKHLYKYDPEPVLFHLDTGGDDAYLDDVGANTHGHIGVNIAIDLDGDDTYTYDAVASEHDRDDLLPSDADGRYAGDEQYGPITLSTHGRQGSARNGIAMLFDLGVGDDQYQSLAMSQGYAHLGVGVLYDEGGHDQYRSETSSQGAALYGIGLLIDAGGDDRYDSTQHSQGSASVAGVAILHDDAGDDVYRADPGMGDDGPLYFSPQQAGEANSSMSQGCGSGIRWDAEQIFVSGGIGILRDAVGDDSYTAGVFAQGAGYWQGTGILSDGDGADKYDSRFYGQGAGAHYALGVLLDGGVGDDAFNTRLSPKSMQLGAGNDFSVGVYVNEAGNDIYRFHTLSLGAGSCSGIGLAVDNGGTDRYASDTTHNTGLGSVSPTCLEARPNATSIGVMLDVQGLDTYVYPAAAFELPANDTVFGHGAHDLASEYGAGLDTTSGDSGIHAN